MDFVKDFFPATQGGRFNLGDNLFSSTKAFRFTLQKGDGNLVLSVLNDDSSGQFIPIWQAGLSQPSGLSPSEFPASAQPYCVMQSDGNFVYYTPPNQPGGPKKLTAVWSTGTNGNGNAFLRCQDDGNLVLISSMPANINKRLWATNTFAGTANRPPAGKL
jgi:hypothetical protein